MKKKYKALLLSCAIIGCTSIKQNKEHLADDLWLEDVKSSRSLGWVKERKKETIKKFASSERFHQSKDVIYKALNSPIKLNWISYIGDEIMNLDYDKEHPLGILRTIPMSESNKENPEWKLQIDFDELSKEQGKEITYGSNNCNFYNPKQCMIGLSEKGKDEEILREFDLSQGKFVENGFLIKDHKTSMQWLDKDTVIYISTDNGTAISKSGYGKSVKIISRNRKLGDAREIYRSEKGDAVFTSSYFSNDKQYTFFSDHFSYNDSMLYYWFNGKPLRINIPLHVSLEGVHNGILLLKPTNDWNNGEKIYPAGSLVGLDLEAATNDEIKTHNIFQPKRNQSLSRVTLSKSKVVLGVIEDMVSKTLIVSNEGKIKTTNGWKRHEVSKPTNDTVRLRSFSPHFDEGIVVYRGFLNPNAIYFMETVKDEHRLWEKSPVTFDTSELSHKYHYAESPDGEKIPFQIVGPKNRNPNKTYPTIIQVYGAHGFTRTAYYRDEIGLAWLRKGGMFVIANVRGGGAYGDRWHKAAIRTKKKQTIDDIATVTRELISRNITTRKEVGIVGGSAGGLAACAAITLYPQLFNAAICRSPIIDLLRFHKLFMGNAWIDEYGDPENPVERKYLRKLSPYHSLNRKTRYPPPLLIAYTNDDRVHPGHARRMVHKMRSLGKEAYYYESPLGGHRGPVTNEDKSKMYALEYEYFTSRLMD